MHRLAVLSSANRSSVARGRRPSDRASFCTSTAARPRSAFSNRPSALEPFQSQPQPPSRHSLLLYSLEFDVSGNGFSIHEGKDGSVYSGDTIEYVRQGRGSCTYVDGATYEGEWQAGKKHGYGIMQFATEGRYEGLWKEDHPHGNGVFVSAQGIRYEGEWNGREITGRYKVNYTDGSSYEGDLRSGRHHGMGVRVYKDSSRYEGHWRNGLRDGRGTMMYKCGLVYEGRWSSGVWHHTLGSSDFQISSQQKSKPARLVRPEIGCYEGEVMNGELTGVGVMRYKDGRRYHGEWHLGSWDGRVTNLTWPGVGFFSGFASEGALVSGKFTFEDGTFWEGRLESSLFHVSELAPLLFQDGVVPTRTRSPSPRKVSVVQTAPVTPASSASTTSISNSTTVAAFVEEGVALLRRVLAAHLAGANKQSNNM